MSQAVNHLPVRGELYHIHLRGKPMLILVLVALDCLPCNVVDAGDLGGDCLNISHRIRSGAMSIAITTLWTACFLLTYRFPGFNSGLGPPGTFWTNAAIRLTGLVFLFFRLPETRGKTLEQIEATPQTRSD